MLNLLQMVGLSGQSIRATMMRGVTAWPLSCIRFAMVSYVGLNALHAGHL